MSIMLTMVLVSSGNSVSIRGVSMNVLVSEVLVSISVILSKEDSFSSIDGAQMSRGNGWDSSPGWGYGWGYG